MGAVYTFEQQLGDLEAVAKALELEKIIPVGHDAGGPAAVNFALRHPTRAAGICLMNAFYDELPGLRVPEFIELFANKNLKALTRHFLASPEQFAWLLNFQRGQWRLPSRPGEFHPEPLTDPDVILSHHPARATARRLPPSVESFKAPPVAGWLAPNVGDLPPSLREHYTRFITSTGQSAPLRRIGTFSLAGSPLVLSPLASPARFSSSVREPK